jgi:hypothetical protein
MVEPGVVLYAESALAVAQSYEDVTVDVFTTVAFAGNPLAVFTDARGLEGATMQQIARELNLSETTFVLPPADAAHTAHVRIFTPQSELLDVAPEIAFAGPTGGEPSFEAGGSVVPIARAELRL